MAWHPPVSGGDDTWEVTGGNGQLGTSTKQTLVGREGA